MSKLRTYTFWENENSFTMTLGDDIPRNANGTPCFNSHTYVARFTIEARTWDEAMAIRNSARLGTLQSRK